MRWVSVSVRGMLRGCSATDSARHHAGMLRRADCSAVQSERAHEKREYYNKSNLELPKTNGPYGGVVGLFDVLALHPEVS